MASSTGPNLQISAKQIEFVRQYLVDFNGTQAAIRAGYSPRTAREQASTLLTKPNIKAELARQTAKKAQKFEITQERVLQEVARLALLDIRKAFNADGSMKHLSEIDDDTAAAISGLEVAEIGMGGDSAPIGVLKKIKLSDKKGALELLMRHMGMLNDKLKLQGDEANPIQTVTRVVIVPPKDPATITTKPLQTGE